MIGYLEDLKAGGRPMTDKELAEHYKHLYSEVKKQKDDVVEYIKKHFQDDEGIIYKVIEKSVANRNETFIEDLLRMLGEIDDN